MSEYELRDLILLTDIFKARSGGEGWYVDSIMQEIPELLSWTTNQVETELRAMEIEHLVVHPAGGGHWSSTHEGRVARERLMRRHRARAACLCDPSQFTTDDLVLAIVAASRTCSIDSEHTFPDERSLSVYLFDRAPDIAASIERLVAANLIEVYDTRPRFGRFLRTLASGLREYHSVVSPRLGIGDAKCVLDPEPESVAAHDSLCSLGLDVDLVNALSDRMAQAEACAEVGSHLGATILYGSVLEGVLAGLAQKFPADANRANGAPRDGAGAVKPFREWKFVEFITVGVEVGWVPKSVAGHVDELRDSRNLVHVQAQIRAGILVDQYLVRITREVLSAVLAGIRDRLNASP